METTEATTSNNAVLAEGVRRTAREFTIEKYGQHNFNEDEKEKVLDYAHGWLVGHLKRTGCLAGFDAVDAIESAVGIVLCQRESKPEVKEYEPHEWVENISLGPEAEAEFNAAHPPKKLLALTEKLFAKVKEMMAEEIEHLASMLKDYPDAADLRDEHQEGIEALRDFEKAATQTF